MLETLKSKWNEVLLYLKEEHEVSDVSFDTWLMPLKVYDVTDDRVVKLIVPDHIFLSYIKKKYNFLLKVAIEEIT
jgi:chromosomal replication initiator protein